MLNKFLEWWSVNFILGLVCLALGLLVIAPLLLVPSWRRRILDSDMDVEGIGLLLLFALLLVVGCYNYFGSGSGA